MAAWTIDASLDASLADLATCTRVSLCSAEPANYAGIAAVSLGSYTLTAGNGNGDWVIANGDTSGRKLTMQAQSGNNATATGAGTDLVFDDGSVMRATRDMTATLNVNSGQAFALNAFDVLEVGDPVNE